MGLPEFRAGRLFPFSWGPPCQASSPPCEVPAGNTHRRLWCAGRTGPSRSSPVRRPPGSRLPGPSEVGLWAWLCCVPSNCLARRGPLDGAEWEDRRWRGAPARSSTKVPSSSSPSPTSVASSPDHGGGKIGPPWGEPCRAAHPRGPASVGPGCQKPWGGFRSSLFQWEVVGTGEGTAG